MTDWETLPLEIQKNILHELAVLRHVSTPSQRKPWCYPAVSKQWQHFFEKQNFRRLVLTDEGDIQALGQYIPLNDRRKHLEHLWLRIKTTRPTPTGFERDKQFWEDGETTRCLRMLMNTVNASGPAKEWNDSLTLELSLHPMEIDLSRLQSGDEGQGLYPRPNDEDCSYSEYCAARRDAGLLYDCPLRRSDMAVFRFIPSDYSSHLEDSQPVRNLYLQPVEAVKELLIRRHVFSRLHLSVLEQIIRCLPGHQRVTIERGWRKRRYIHEAPQQVGHKWLLERLREASAAGTRSFSLLDDPLPLNGRGEVSVWRVPDEDPMDPTELGGEPTERVGVGETYLLQHLSIAFSNDAGRFFRDFYPGLRHRSTIRAEWPCLKSLALTSQAMHPKRSSEEISKLLVAAARSTLMMPKLETLEIWNGGDGFACIFRYQTAHKGTNRPTITLARSWDYSMPQAVLSAWEEVALSQTVVPRGLAVQVVSLSPKSLKSHASVMGLLELCRLVVHPVTLCYLRWQTDAKVRTKPAERTTDGYPGDLFSF
ncbi:hypothetical protein QBC34DRAFT_455310 [Podospora aff. communis PSN243]|uniref:DUF6546 domain-containing protein n=1 Tax=Podospora aff. communis PSN243 TaxID=3040156 RepID=A0AAV9H0Y7_9PEZI|nr:hypothetical protein QBC34DRAFT_455310 [Podospora aff. communis PSN243]